MESTRKFERNVRITMIKSSLLADLLEVLLKKRGKTLCEFVWLPFTQPLSMAVRLLSFRCASFCFIFDSIDSPFPRCKKSRSTVRTSALKVDNFSMCCRIMKPYRFKNDRSQLMSEEILSLCDKVNFRNSISLCTVILFM